VLEEQKRPIGRALTQVGVVGLGKMGILHAGILNSMPETRVMAVCEHASILASVARKLLPKSIAIYKDHQEMVENERLDAIFITTPIDTHVPIVLDIVRADKDVNLFVEKPLGSSHKQARLACEAVAKLQGVNMVGYQKRFSPVFRRAKEFIDTGSLGDLMFFRSHLFSSDMLHEGNSWRLQKGGGGVLLDLAPHLIDILVWYFGEPESVQATRGRFYSRQVDDYLLASMSFRSGLKGHIETCWSVRGFRLPELSIEIHGKKGTLTVTDDFVRLESGSENNYEPVQLLYKQSFDSSVPFLLADPEYTMEDEAFLRGENQPTSPKPDFFEAAKVNGLIDRMIESAT